MKTSSFAAISNFYIVSKSSGEEELYSCLDSTFGEGRVADLSKALQGFQGWGKLKNGEAGFNSWTSKIQSTVLPRKPIETKPPAFF